MRVDRAMEVLEGKRSFECEICGRDRIATSNSGTKMVFKNICSGDASRIRFKFKCGVCGGNTSILITRCNVSGCKREIQTEEGYCIGHKISKGFSQSEDED